MYNADKKALRRALLAERLAIPKEEKATLDAALCEAIATHAYFKTADALLGYYPMRGEPDLIPLLVSAARRGIPVFLPHCTANGMKFYRFTSEPELVPDRYGIPSPPAGEEPAATADTLCLIPGLAADKNGTRLGYGGGYYDRFLPRFAGKTIFALYDRFVWDKLPCDAHDCNVSLILTEKKEVRHV